MKNIYVDTNLILGPFRKQDQNFIFMEKIKSQKHLDLVSSTLSIVEMYSVLFRQYDYFMKEVQTIYLSSDEDKMQDFSVRNQIFLAIECLLRYYNINIIDDGESDLFSIHGKGTRIDPIFSLALKIEGGNGLKTLNLLHYSYAKYFTDYRDIPIDYLVTSDTGFQSARAKLKTDSPIVILSPETQIDIEC